MDREKTITIYSVGLLGGSIGLALKKSGYQGTIIGLSSPKAIEQSLELGCIDEGYGYDQLEKIIKRTDIIILCSPIEIILKTIKKLSKMELPKGLIITDVGSTKANITFEAKELLPPHVNFIAGHPMAGSEKSGPTAADPFLFQNAIYVLYPLENVPAEIFKEFSELLTKHLGCREIVIDPDTHDQIAATVSHVPHLLAVALVNTAELMEKKIAGTMELAAGGFRDMTRIASAPYKMWHDIFNTNKQKITTVLDICIEQLQDMKHRLKINALEEPFESAAETRSEISRGAGKKGFLSPLSEVLVITSDQPGMIAKISNLLANDNINIKDIEVLKVREGEGGTIRLAFENVEISQKAIYILNQNGFSARERA